jgi:hypothetical protein
MPSFKKILFFLKRLKTDIVENKQININTSFTEELKRYYILFSEDTINSRGGNKPMKFDEKGVPLIHSYIDVEDQKGYYYYPITIGQYALAVFHSWLDSNDESKKEHFLRIADWFYNSRIEDDELGVYWLTETPKPEYKISSPWKSAFAQSRGLSIMMRAWQLTGDNKFLDASKKALKTFTKDISQGGVAVNITEKNAFYEEYVAEKPTRVLDGHIFSLWGLYDFIRAIDKEKEQDSYLLAKELFDKGIEGLINSLPKYDMNFWVLFNRCELSHYPKKDPCTIGYLRLIVKQMEVLYNITNREELKDFYTKFSKYDKLPNIIRMYFIKFKALKKLQRL